MEAFIPAMAAASTTLFGTAAIAPHDFWTNAAAIGPLRHRTPLSALLRLTVEAKGIRITRIAGEGPVDDCFADASDSPIYSWAFLSRAQRRAETFGHAHAGFVALIK